MLCGNIVHINNLYYSVVSDTLFTRYQRQGTEHPERNHVRYILETYTALFTTLCPIKCIEVSSCILQLTRTSVDVSQ